MIYYIAIQIRWCIELSIQIWTSCFFENEDEFDLSEMTGNFKCVKQNVLGKFKSEVGHTIITELLALSPKSYSYKYCEK